MPVPRQENKILNVCLICCDKLSKVQSSEKVIDIDVLPGVILDRKSIGRSSSKSNSSDVNDIFEVDSSAILPGEILEPVSLEKSQLEKDKQSDINDNLDTVITNRLKELKGHNNLPSDDEIRARLSNLNNRPQKNYDKKFLLLDLEKRTDQEKMNNLLEQFAEEADVNKRLEEKQNKSISDIEKRLKALRDSSPIDAGPSSRTNLNVLINQSFSDLEEDSELSLEAVIEKVTFVL